MLRRCVQGSVLSLVLLLAACGASGGEDANSPFDGEAGDRATTTEADATTEPSGSDAGDDGGSTETTEAAEPSGDGACDALRVIADYDIEAGDLIASSSWADVQAFFIDSIPEVTAAYDDAIAAVPELAEPLATLRDFTASTADTAADATSVEDFGFAMLDLPGVMEGGAAALEVNAYAEETCGFSTGNN
jgi:hypothetical protein